jgi:hypothetical protein
MAPFETGPEGPELEGQQADREPKATYTNVKAERFYLGMVLASEEVVL